uniref:Uncharacterized protein n=1 Tax=Rhizophora mucronata TaxID=61149 RepID=A0A2P2Q8N0_RHIMU
MTVVCNPGASRLVPTTFSKGSQGVSRTRK